MNVKNKIISQLEQLTQYLSDVNKRLAQAALIALYLLILLWGIQILSEIFTTATVLYNSGLWWSSAYILLVIVFASLLAWGAYRVFLEKKKPIVFLEKKKPIIRRTAPTGQQQSEDIEHRLNSVTGISSASLPEGVLEVPVVGIKYVGKSSLIHYCEHDSPLANKLGADLREVKLIEAPSITSDPAINQQILTPFDQLPLSIFVVSQDLTDYELEAIRYLVGNGSPVLVVLNKADNLKEDDVIELKASVRNKIEPVGGASGPVVVSTAPAPRTRIKQEKNGGEVAVELPSEPDMSQFTDEITRFFQARKVSGIVFRKGGNA